jgi:predicted N-acetyltransferase YhbS
LPQGAEIDHVHPDGNPIIRCETTGTEEWLVVHSVNEAAFGRPDEANLVDCLRSEGVILASVVAELEKRIAIVLGHPDYYRRFGFSSGKARSLWDSREGEISGCVRTRKVSTTRLPTQ